MVAKAAPAALINRTNAYEREMLRVGGLLLFDWLGYALVRPGVTAAILDIIVPSRQRDVADTVGLVIPATAVITRVGVRVPSAVTLGAATGKLKIATSLTQNSAVLTATSAAASSNSLAAAVFKVDNNLNVASTGVGGADVTYRIYATDGAALGSEAASTVTAAAETRLEVQICGYMHDDFALAGEAGYTITG